MLRDTSRQTIKTYSHINNKRGESNGDKRFIYSLKVASNLSVNYSFIQIHLIYYKRI